MSEGDFKTVIYLFLVFILPSTLQSVKQWDLQLELAGEKALVLAKREESESKM